MGYDVEVVERARARLAQAKADRDQENARRLAQAYAQVPRLKQIATLALLFHWWNPILWLAFRLHIRDMELACDEAVIEKLDGQGRREYAKALVELASGQHLWGGVTSFGECDAAIRVKRVTAWRDRGKLYHRLSLVLTVLLVLFFYCGGPIYRG